MQIFLRFSWHRNLLGLEAVNENSDAVMHRMLVTLCALGMFEGCKPRRYALQLLCFFWNTKMNVVVYWNNTANIYMLCDHDYWLLLGNDKWIQRCPGISINVILLKNQVTGTHEMQGQRARMYEYAGPRELACMYICRAHAHMLAYMFCNYPIASRSPSAASMRICDFF